LSEIKPESSTNPSGVFPTGGGMGGAGAAHAFRILGDFELRREVGHGGMGTVYEAWQRTLQRVVALKVLGRHVSESPNAVARFQREAVAAAKLNHSHIIPIYAQGEIDGCYFYAMEFVDGKSLDRIIREEKEARSSTTSPELAETVPLARPNQPDSLDTGSNWATRTSGSSKSWHESVKDRFAAIAHHMAMIADALDYAHRQGVIHRDIKPHNLILGPDSRVRISDFGLARLTEHPGVTISGELIGSPLYMSREQIVEGPARVDHRTDIYSLGATMYEWLTLTPPFTGPTRERVISQIVHDDPPAPRTVEPRVPVALETICLKAIDKQTTRRYQSAGELRDDLLRFLSDRPISARRDSLLMRTRKFAARHPAACAFAGFGAVLLLLVLALFDTRRDVRTNLRAAQQATQKLADEQERTSQIIDLVGRLPPEVVAMLTAPQHVAPVMSELLETGKQITAAAKPPLITAEGSQVEAVVRLARRAATDLLGAIHSLEPIELTDQPDEAQTYYMLALDASDLEEANRLVDEALARKSDFFEARILRVALLCINNRYEHMAREAAELAKLRPGVPSVHWWCGLAGLLANDVETSLREFTEAVRLDGLSAWSRTLRGLALLKAQRLSEAVEEFDRALSWAPNQVVALLGRANIRANQGQLSEAIADATRVLDQEPGNIDALMLRADCWFKLQRFDQAQLDFQKLDELGELTQVMMIQLYYSYARQQAASEAKTEGDQSDDASPQLPSDAPHPAQAPSPPAPIPAPSGANPIP